MAKTHILEKKDIEGEVHTFTYRCLAELVLERGWENGDSIDLSPDAEFTFHGRNSSRRFIQLVEVELGNLARKAA